MMTGANGWIITFLVLAFIAITGNSLSIIQLLRLGSLKAITSKLILFLHISGLIHSIGQMPLLYYQTEVLCEIMGFVHFYAGLVNALALVLLSMSYTNFVLEKSERNIPIQKYCTPIVFVIPLIALLPFTTHSYGASDIWCTLPITNEVSNIWAFMVSYIEVTIALFYSSGMLIYLVVYTWKDRSITQTIFSTAGVYILVTWIGLIPGLIPRLLEACGVPIDNTNSAGEFFEKAPSNIASIAYCICFVVNYESFTFYEKHFSQSNEENGMIQEISIVELEKIMNERLISIDNDGRGSQSRSRRNRFSSGEGGGAGGGDDMLVSQARSRSIAFIGRYLAQFLHSSSLAGREGTKPSTAAVSTENPLRIPSRLNEGTTTRASTGSVLEVE